MFSFYIYNINNNKLILVEYNIIEKHINKIK